MRGLGNFRQPVLEIGQLLPLIKELDHILFLTINAGLLALFKSQLRKSDYMVN